jgi:sodium/bile acid cotransporter 7
LAFNATALQLLSCLKQKEESVFASKEYSRAVILVASQVSTYHQQQKVKFEQIAV